MEQMIITLLVEYEYFSRKYRQWWPESINRELNLSPTPSLFSDSKTSSLHMETISLCSLILPLSIGISESFCSLKRYRAKMKIHAKGRSGSSHESDCKGLLVDENLIVLRKRIHEMKVVKRNYEPPEEWTEWEKQHYSRYDELICKVVGLTQLQLMNTRPQLALGVLMLVLVSIPVSAGIIISQMIEIAHGVLLSSVHLN